MMSLFSTKWSADRSPLLDRSVEDPPPLTEHAAGDSSLPRHVLVSLAGIIADVTSLQQRCVDPDLQASLETTLGRLDGLVDSIYQHAADPRALREHRSFDDSGSPTDALAEVPVELASNVATAGSG